MEYRDNTFDVMKGIAIIAMVLGHTHIPKYASDFIFVWHMPLFFIVSGYFYKPYPIPLYIQKNSRQLLLPYVLTSIVMIGMTYLKDILYDEKNTLDMIMAALLGNGTENNANFRDYVIGATWFLLALFWCRIFFNFLFQKCSFSWKLLISVSCISVIATFCGTQIFIPTDILQGLQAMFFFGVGYMLKYKNVFSYKIKTPELLLIVFVGALSVYSGSMSMARCYYGFWPVNVFAAIGFTLVIYRISEVISCKLIHSNRLLAYIGRISIVVLCVHELEFFFMPLSLFHNLLEYSQQIDIIIHLFVALAVSLVIAQFSFVRKMFSLK